MRAHGFLRSRRGAFPVPQAPAGGRCVPPVVGSEPDGLSKVNTVNRAGHGSKSNHQMDRSFPAKPIYQNLFGYQFVTPRASRSRRRSSLSFRCGSLRSQEPEVGQRLRTRLCLRRPRTPWIFVGSGEKVKVGVLFAPASWLGLLPQPLP